MRVKPIPRHTLFRFMSVFLAEAQRRDSSSVSLQSDATKFLRERKDFHTVLRTLEALGHIRVTWTDTNVPLRIHLTDSGRAYLETSREVKSEQRWTRGLAIAALIISLAALALEIDGRGYFDWAKPGKIHTAQSVQDLPILPVHTQ